MSGLSYEYAPPDLDAARRALDLGPAELEAIVYAIGEAIVTQTKPRIAAEKRGPEGEAWAPWSAAYAATRSGGHSLLQGEGHLLDSIANHSAGMEAVVGTNLVYSAIQQFGGDPDAGHAPIPARPYLGLSGENRREIEELVVNLVEGMI